MSGPLLSSEFGQPGLERLLAGCELEITPGAAALLALMPRGGCLANIADLVAAGRLTLLEDPEEVPRFGGGERREPAAEAPADGSAPPEQETWIKFRVVDHDTDAPIPGVRLRIREPGEREREYTTRADGMIEINEIDPGTCDILEMTEAEVLEVVRVE